MKKEQVNKQFHRILKTMLLAAFMVLALPITAKADLTEEKNVSRSVLLDLNGGSTTWSGWLCLVDRSGNGLTGGTGWWFVPGSGNIGPVDVGGKVNWSAGNKGQADDRDRNRVWLTPNVWESQYMDCVGITPYMACDTPTRSGYTFTGWTTTGSRNGVTSYGGRAVLDVGAYAGTVVGNGTNITMKANWKQNAFTLTYNGNGGTPSKSSQKANQGAAWGTLATASRTGYTFDGWYTASSGGSQITASTVCGGNVTAYAHWTANTYTLTYDKNNPPTALADDIVLERTSQTAKYDSAWGTLSVADKTGYTFLGWYTAKTGGSKVTNATICKGDLTVYAQWSANTYTLTYRENNPSTALSDDITLSRSKQTSIFDTPWGELATATKPGYLFQGWYLEAEGTTKISASTICKGDLTVYARWKPITYLIRFHPNAENGLGDATGTMPAITMTYDQAINLPKNQYQKLRTIPSEDENGAATKLPSVFRGWSLNPESIASSWADEAKLLNLSKVEGDIFDFYAIWDDAPTFSVGEYPDRYFTLDEAQNGVVTERELLETVVVYDRETNPLPKKDTADVANTGSDIGITVVGYDSTEFTSLTDDSTITIRYKVKDTSGNETHLNINVYVTRNGALPEKDATHYRSISKDYNGKASGEGGLAEESYWRKDTDTYGKLLSNALQDIPTTAYDLFLGKHLMAEIRDHVDDEGFGNSQTADGLDKVWNILGEEAP